MKQHNGLETTLERVGRILSRKYNIDVRCKGNACKTDGRTIWLPALPENISESLWGLVRGELDHETAHILFSDFTGKMKDFRQTWGDFGFDLLNVIEDVRVNHAMQKEYPGSRQNILHSIHEIIKDHPIDQMPLEVRFLCSLFLAGMGLPYDAYGNDAGELVDLFQQEIKQFKSLKSTDQACEMAESILKQLKHPQQQQGAQTASQQNGKPKDSNEGQKQTSPNSSSSNASDNSQANSSESDESNGDACECQDASEEESNNAQGSITKVLSGKYQSNGHPFEIQKTIERHVQDQVVNQTDQPYRVYDASRDRVVIPRASDNGEAYQNLYSEVRPYVSALRQQLIRTMRSKDAKFWVGEQEEGHINSRRLYTLLNQDSNKVFRKTTVCETNSVATSLLIDLSGSMSGPRIQMARQVAILFAETLNQLRIPFEVIGFSTEPSKRTYLQVSQETGMDLQELSKHYARFFPCVFSIFKAFNEPYRAIKPRIPSMTDKEYTPMDDAILFCAKRMVPRKETRKLVLVLTDGEPYSGNSIMQHLVIERLETILGKCKQAGIECSAIGIQSNFVENHFEDYIVVQELADLPKAFYKKFSRLLRKSN